MRADFSLTAFCKKALDGDRGRFLKYLLVGGWNTIFGVTLYSLLCWFFQDKVHYLLLLIPANIVAVLNAYLCYKFFVFKTQGDYLSEFLRCSFVYGGAMVCSAGILFLLVDRAALSPIVANIISVGVVTGISFLSHKFFSFRKSVGTDELAGIFYLILLGVAGLFMLSAYRVPSFWLDEIHITEMGRAVVCAGKGYASFMCLSDGTVFLPFYYLGPLIQDMAYRMFGYVGPRWSALAGLLVATVFCRWWLLRRTGSSSTAFWFPLLVLTHPFFNQSARLVRVDSWALALFFAALWLINGIDKKGQAVKWRDSLLLGSAGGLAAAAIYVWPTAFLFVGYCAVEYLSIRRQRSCFGAAFVFSAGFILGGFLLLLPIPDFAGVVRKTLVEYFNVGTDLPKPSFDIGAAIYGFFFFIVKETLRSPFMMLLCVWGLFLNRKDWRVLLITVGSVGIIVVSNLHTFRLIYLFPLLLIFAAEAFEVLKKKKQYFKLFITLALGYGVWTSVLFPVFSAHAYSMRDYSILKQRLSDTLGVGAEVRVYSRAFEPYYPARDLSWSCFRYANDDLLEEDASNLRLLDRVDYVIDSRKERRYYSIEEGGTFYHLLRDCCIQRAERDKAGLLAGIGQKFAFRDSDEKKERLELVLTRSGFGKYTVLKFSEPQARRGGGFVGWSSVVPEYDDLIIWKREKIVGLVSPGK